MGWVYRDKSHRCHPPPQRPMFRRVSTGDKWQCRRCKAVWTLTYVTYPDSRYSMTWRTT